MKPFEKWNAGHDRALRMLDEVRSDIDRLPALIQQIRSIGEVENAETDGFVRTVCLLALVARKDGQGRISAAH